MSILYRFKTTISMDTIDNTINTKTVVFNAIQSSDKKQVIVTEGITIFAVVPQKKETLAQAVERVIRNMNTKEAEGVSITSVEVEEDFASPEVIINLSVLEKAKKDANKKLKQLEEAEMKFNEAQDKFSLMFRTEQQKADLEESKRLIAEYYKKLAENNKIADEVTKINFGE